MMAESRSSLPMMWRRCVLLAVTWKMSAPPSRWPHLAAICWPVYNVSEAESFGELDWARKIAAATGWQGEFVVLPHDSTPKHLLWPGNTAQHLVASSSASAKSLAIASCCHVKKPFAAPSNGSGKSAGSPTAQFNYEAEDEALAKFKATA